MCGITGFVDATQATSAAECAHILSRMTTCLRHRGPDDQGFWADASCGVALGQRRLAIIDLSPGGRQPMVSASGRYVIALNGEIYNYREIRGELERSGMNPAWRGHSDTEVLLEAIDAWGVEPALQRVVGMFAFAAFDRTNRKLYLARDRIGEKPLYYGLLGGTFIFGSELKALCAHPEWRGEIDRDSLAGFLRHNYVACPRSIYRNVKKLPPGTLMEVPTARVLHSLHELRPNSYWSLAESVAQGRMSPFAGDDGEALAQLEALLRRAVRQQMLATDVPLGAFLSGGIDSSTVVALMQQESSRPVKTFTIGFREEGFDEAKYAKAVAAHLGTDHTELYLSASEARAVIPQLPGIYDEPFADSSQIPTFLVSQLTRRYVTVALSGDGGDELFGGYTRYVSGLNLWRKICLLPPAARRVLARGITSVPAVTWDTSFRWLQLFIPQSLRQTGSGDKLHKLAALMTVQGEHALYRGLVSHWPNPGEVVIGICDPASTFVAMDQHPHLSDFSEWMMYTDAMTYLPDDILVKVDRAAMSVGLETRVPYLDHRVVEFAWTLPLHLRIRKGTGKWLIRKLLQQYVPESLTNRPKMGFGIPLGHWLRHELRDWAEELLDSSRLRNDGYFHPGPIREKWDEHLSGRRNWQYWLWDVLMFQAWRASQHEQRSAALLAASAV